MSHKKKLLVVNSHIPWGGLGQYSIGLARAMSTLGEFEVFGLVTHNKAGNFESFSNATRSTKFVGNKPKLIKYPLILFYIWRLRPHVIIINYNAPAHFLLPFLPKTKILTILHSDDSDYYRIASINHTYVNAWIAPTPKTRRGIIEYLGANAPAERVHVIPHGVTWGTKRAKVRGEGRFEIVFAGALFRHKGVDLLPEIFSRFSMRHPDTFLSIAGEGPMRDALLRDFVRLNLQDKVSLTGLLSSEDVRDLFSQADVLLFPTRLEGFGLVVAEAMTAGCVPVLTHLEGITDSIVSSGTTGFLVEMNDIDSFVNCLSLLYEDRALLGMMSARATEVAREKFSLARMADNYTLLINNI